MFGFFDRVRTAKADWMFLFLAIHVSARAMDPLGNVACQAFINELDSHCRTPYPSSCRWGQWGCDIYLRGGSWHFDCENSTHECQYASGADGCSGDCSALFSGFAAAGVTASIAGTLGFILLLCACAGCYYCCCRRASDKRNEADDPQAPAIFVQTAPDAYPPLGAPCDPAKVPPAYPLPPTPDAAEYGEADAPPVYSPDAYGAPLAYPPPAFHGEPHGGTVDCGPPVYVPRAPGSGEYI